MTGLACSCSCPMGGKAVDRMDAAGVDVLLVSGLHANETAAPLVAAAVRRRLGELGVRVALVAIPRSATLLGLLDDPAGAMTRYSQPVGTRRLDMDLEGFDAVLAGRYPGALVFEFHNTEDSHRILSIDPARPTCDYEVGTVGPDFVRPYDIGTWRNIDAQGRPGKFLIELPGHYGDVPHDRLAVRRERLRGWQAAGFAFEASLAYLEREVDVAASRRRGYLDDCLAAKVAAWIVACAAIDPRSASPP